MRIGPFGIWEILIVLVVAIVVFGPRRLPEMAKGLGQSVREFRKGIRDMRDEYRDEAASEATVTTGTGATPERRPAQGTGATPDVKASRDATDAPPPPTPA